MPPVNVGPPLGLSSSDLEKVGLVAMLEARAKHLMWITLSPVCGLRDEEWYRMQDRPFDQIMKKLIAGMSNLAEPDLKKKVQAVDDARAKARVMRNAIIHGHWALDSEDHLPILPDMRGGEHLRREDIDRAVEGTAALCATAWDAFKELLTVGQRGGLPFAQVVNSPEEL